jgi:hypothetical protein
MRRQSTFQNVHSQSFASVGQNSGKGMSSIILTGSNVSASDRTNSTLVYNFPSSVSFPNHEIAVSSVSMYYAWYNIDTSATVLNNNQFSYTWVVGVTTTTYQVIIPAGIYEIADINNFLQFTMIQNGHYLINSASENVYYAEFLVNVNRYSVDINTFPVPTSLPTGFTQPVANPATGALAWGGYPTQVFNPLITIPATNNFYKIVGYVAGFATSQNTNIGTNLSYHSSVAPQVQPNPTLFLNCNLVNNIYSNPSTNIFAITPTGALGSQIVIQPSEFTYNTIQGTTASLVFQLRGQSGSPITIQDTNMTIVLCIRERSVII